jgi:hypothetical protein
MERSLIMLLCQVLLTGCTVGHALASEPEAAHVSGTAVTNGLAPVPHATVRAGGKTAVADSEGRFAIDVPAGERALTISAPGLPPWTLRDVRRNAQVTAVLGQSRTMSAARMTDARADRDAGDDRAVKGTCTGHTSNRVPPEEIRVLVFGAHDEKVWGVPGTEQGVQTVPFREYVEDVLPSEWPAAWPAESLQAGAFAVKNYAWYWTQKWRGGQFQGECFDVDDSIAYQRYVPGAREPATGAAVEATWHRAAHKGEAVFPTNYRATLTGKKDEPCGAGRDVRPQTLSQWGSRACALEGRAAPDILSLYYPGAVVN